jgi:phosphoribosylformylglycinamidine (FGAM) synthase PurS component
MVGRIEVCFKKGTRDALAENIRKRILEDLHLEVSSVRTIDIYTINEDLSGEQKKLLGEKVFADPVIQDFSDKPIAEDFSWLIEVGFRP